MPARPLSVTVAVVLLALGSLLNVISPLTPVMGVSPPSSFTRASCWAYSASSGRSGCGC